jgi:hypothetical protein
MQFLTDILPRVQVHRFLELHIRHTPGPIADQRYRAVWIHAALVPEHHCERDLRGR